MTDEEVPKPSMSDQPATTKMPAVNPVEVAIAKLAAAQERGFAGVHTDLESIRRDVHENSTDLESMKNESQRANMRLTRIEMRQDDVETRLTRASTGVRGLTDHDLDLEAKLAAVHVQFAEEKAKREALEAHSVTKNDVQQVVTDATLLQTAALVNEISKNKKLRAIAGLVAALVIGWLTSRVTATAPPPPQPPAIQVPK